MLAKHGSLLWFAAQPPLPALAARIDAPIARAAPISLAEGSPPARGPPALRFA
jgi:hypothetical protein